MPKQFDIGIPGIPFSKEQKHAYANRCSIYNWKNCDLQQFCSWK
jgi:hypothetical protein